MLKEIIGIFLAVAGMAVVVAADSQISPIPCGQVRFSSGVFAARQRINADVTLPYILEQCESSGRIGIFGEKTESNKKADGLASAAADVYRLIAGASYRIALDPDESMSEKLRGIAEKIRAAQKSDGRLHDRDELSDAGCLYEAAVAYEQATGDRSLLDVALKHADYLLKKNKKGLPLEYFGAIHGLLGLYRSSGDERLLQFAMGGMENYMEKFSGNDRSGPQKSTIGQIEEDTFAARANGSCAGVAELAAISSKKEHVSAANKLWRDFLGGRILLTGGCGVREKDGHMLYGAAYELPTDLCGETCASTSSAEWAHSMFLLTGEASCMDVFERILYNGVFAGVSLDGERHSSWNPLEYNGRVAYDAFLGSWDRTSCCSTSLVRLIASLGGYAYATRDDTLYALLYASGEVKWNGIRVVQTTEYPWDGKVTLKIGADAPTGFKLALRIPEWCIGRPLPSNLYTYDNINAAPWSFTVNGKRVAYSFQRGFAVVDRTWNDGDTVELTLPMEIRRVHADSNVDNLRKHVAFERGPIVYAFESCDNKDRLAHEARYADKNVKIFPEYRGDLLGGVETLHFVDDICDFTGIPYACWGNRGRHAMRVWLDDAPPLPNLNEDKALFAVASASFTQSDDALSRVNDALFPKDSLVSHDAPCFSFSPHRGGDEWITYIWEKPVEVSVCSIFWIDDIEQNGSCKIPDSWRIQYLDNGVWIPVRVMDQNESSVRFEPVVTTSLRLDVKQHTGCSVGICEWLVR